MALAPKFFREVSTAESTRFPRTRACFHWGITLSGVTHSARLLVYGARGSDKPAAASSGNILLDSLPPTAREKLGCRLVRLAPRQRVHDGCRRLKYALFPVSGFVSLLMVTDHKPIEVGVIGKEGFFGLPVILGINRSPMVAIAQTHGEVIRVEAASLLEQVQANPSFAAAIARYAYAFNIMLAQGSVCRGLHQIEQQCVKWLLMAHDRLQQDTFPLTHQMLAQRLSVRRATVSKVADSLKRRKLIGYEKGQVAILDRAGLERAACSCYGTIRQAFVTASGEAGGRVLTHTTSRYR